MFWKSWKCGAADTCEHCSGISGSIEVGKLEHFTEYSLVKKIFLMCLFFIQGISFYERTEYRHSKGAEKFEVCFVLCSVQLPTAGWIVNTFLSRTLFRDQLLDIKPFIM
jgi:hypothetical protein